MKTKRTGKILSLLLAVCMVLIMMPTVAFADSTEIAITGKGVSTIKNEIEAALESKDAVTVTGLKTGVEETLQLAITEGKTVVWQASITGYGDNINSLIILTESGTFEVAAGGSVTATTGTAIYRSSTGPIVVNGGNVTSADSVTISSLGSSITVRAGTVKATGANKSAIGTGNSAGTVTVEGGVVEATNGGDAIVAAGAVTVSGDAVVRATGSGHAINAFSKDVTVSGDAVVIAAGSGRAINAVDNVTVEGGTVRATTGYAIYTTGTTTVSGDAVVFAHGSNADIYVISGGSFTTEENGVIIAWNKPAEGIPTYTEGEYTALTKIPNHATAAWDKVGGNSGIAYTNGANTGFLAIDGVTVNLPSAFYTISGIIRGSDTGSGITTASLVLKDETGGEVANTSTGPDGEYSFTNILAGTYSIEVSVNGYNTATINNVVLSNTDITDQDLTLTRQDYYGTYGLIVGDIVVTDENKGNITGSAITGKISYDPSTKTLTLEDAKIGMSSFNPIIASENLTVKLIGSSVLGLAWEDDPQGQIGIGISGDKNITLTGDGNLSIYNLYSGIEAKNITIDMGGTLTIDEEGSSGMACTLKANGGTITINKGTLNLSSRLSNGIYGNSIVINGGSITAYSKNENNAGLFAFNRAPSFGRDYWYKVYAGNDEVSAANITAPNSRTYTNSKYVKIEQSPEGTGLRGGGSDNGGGSGGGGSYKPPAIIPPTPEIKPEQPIIGTEDTSGIDSSKFTDIDNHWAKEAIDFVVGRGLLAGTSETTFAPNTAMTRGMLVTVLGRLADVDTQVYSANSFTDVSKDKYYTTYIEWAYSKGIVQGIGNQQFAPDRAVTREEIAVIFANYTKATDYKLPINNDAATYADNNSIGDIYKTSVIAMQQAGIMIGDTNNLFNPKFSATRAEVSAMLQRYIELVIEQTNE